VTVPNTRWSHRSFQSKPLPGNFYGPHLPITILSPLDYVKKYLPDEHFEETALYTNMYEMSKVGKELKTKANKIKIVYGVQAMKSIFKYSRLKMYWSSKSLCFDPISQAITRR